MNARRRRAWASLTATPRTNPYPGMRIKPRDLDQGPVPSTTELLRAEAKAMLRGETERAEAYRGKLNQRLRRAQLEAKVNG